MNEAIKLAIEKGGYVVDTSGYWLWLGDASAEEKLGKRVYRLLGTDAASIAEITNDPKFWQALGKALGWKGKVCEDCSIREGKHLLEETWLYHALRYHELNLTGGDTEKFWKELLN